MADAFTETEFLQLNALNTSYEPAYVPLKNIVFNGEKIELTDLYAGSAATCQKVFPAAVQSCKAVLPENGTIDNQSVLQGEK